MVLPLSITQIVHVIKTTHSNERINLISKVKVSDDNSYVELVNPTTSEPICLPVMMGLVKSMSDFALNWNEEHKK